MSGNQKITFEGAGIMMLGAFTQPVYRCPKHGEYAGGLGAVQIWEKTPTFDSKEKPEMYCIKCYQAWIRANLCPITVVKEGGYLIENNNEVKE